MKPALFDYRAAGSVAEAVALLAAEPGAVVLAGGQSLIPAMNMRLANPSRLVDIGRIPGLDRIEVAGGAVRVGAMVRHRALETSDAAFRAQPLLRAALAHVAHVPIRNRGTVVGSLCHADAAAEMPVILLLTGGSVLAEGPAGRREIEADAFFRTHLTTARDPSEVVVEARFPVLPAGAGHAFLEFARRSGDYALASVGAILRLGSDGRIAGAQLAAGGIAARPVRLAEAEALLAGQTPHPDLFARAGRAAAPAVTAPDEIHATQGYRRRLLSTLVARALAAAAARATPGAAA